MGYYVIIDRPMKSYRAESAVRGYRLPWQRLLLYYLIIFYIALIDV